MEGAINKAVDLYRQGKSLPDVSAIVGIPTSTVRYHVKKAGILRTRTEGVRLSSWKVGTALKGKKRVFSDAHCRAIQSGRAAWGEKNSSGVSQKSSGYVVITRGPNKGRMLHVTKMEERLGRRLLSDEVVHHIDGDRSNNNLDNLALMTRAAHSRLHRFEDQLAGKIRERDQYGRFS